MMRVVMAGPLPPMIGGMSTVIDDIAHSSLAREVELKLFDTGKRTPEGRSFLTAIRVRFDIWMSWWRMLMPASRTVAHIHTCSGLTYFLDGVLLCFARMRGVPTVLHIHGGRFDTFLDQLPLPLRVLARLVARAATRVVVLSPDWESKLHARLPGVKITVIENGVPIPHAVVAPQKGAKIIALFIGGMITRKGVRDLVCCASALLPEVQLVLVGGEEEPGILSALRSQIELGKLEDKVILAGPAVGAAKHAWLQQADIFVLPSYVEGVPISMLEAAAAGLPLIVTPVGGIPSVLTDGEHALFVQPGDHDALASAINRLASEPLLRARLGGAVREHVLARYGIENTAHKYLDLYRELNPALLSPQVQTSKEEAKG